MYTLNTIDTFVGRFLSSSALCSLTAAKDENWTASDKNENRAILFFKKIMLSSYYASSLFFKTVIILVCLSTQKMGCNSLIKK